MLSPHTRNRISDHPQKVMSPVHLKLSEDMIDLLKETAKVHGFNKMQGLIRLYIREGLDRDNDKYTLYQDEVFLDKLKENGVNEDLIRQAIIDTNKVCLSETRYQTCDNL